jgi:hypothetical protein
LGYQFFRSNRVLDMRNHRCTACRHHRFGDQCGYLPCDRWIIRWQRHLDKPVYCFASISAPAALLSIPASLITTLLTPSFFDTSSTSLRRLRLVAWYR